jgi:hypothetical protein
VLLDEVSAKQELILPPKIQLDQAKGVSLDMLKATPTVAAMRWLNWHRPICVEDDGRF